jgi:molecular chaperone GrpE
MAAKDPFAEQTAKLLQAVDFASEMEAREKEHEAQWRAMLLSLVDIMDSFDRFFAAVGGEGPEKLVGNQTADELNTVRLIARQLDRVLRQAGLTPITCLGQEVDPQRHEIIEVKDTNEAEDDSIIEVVRRGYEWNGQLLRQPQVVVARNVKEETR